MRRFLLLVSIAVVAMLDLGTVGVRPDADALDATPATQLDFQGVRVEPLASGPVPKYPPLPAEIALYRVRIAPGSRIVTPADDVALGLVYVESGTLAARRTVAGVVTRGAALATPGVQREEAVPANTEVVLEEGDAYVAPPGSGGEVRNDGTEDAIILDVVIASTMAATPTP